MRFSRSLLIPALILSGMALRADLTITFDVKGKGMFKGAGGPQTEYYTETYHLTRDPGDKKDTLVDYTKGITYTIDHKKQTLGIMKMEDALAAMESMNAQHEQMPAMMGALFGDPNDVSVNKEGTEKVADRTCTRYKIRIAKLNADICADPSLKMPVPDALWAKGMRARAATMAAAGPAAAAFKRMYEEMAKIKGVALKIVMGGGMMPTIERTATSVAQTPVDPSLFKLPAGYKTEDLGKKMREDMAKGRK